MATNPPCCSEQNGIHDCTNDDLANFQFDHPHYKSLQITEAKSDQNFDPIGKSFKHLSAEIHATGEANYVDDMSNFEDQLYLGFVFSSEPHARILELNVDEAMSMPGVKAFFSAADMKSFKNDFSTTVDIDEEVFASEKVNCVGQIIGVVAASDQKVAERAAAKVKVAYEPLPFILTIEDAIKQGSLFTKFGDRSISIQKGDAQAAFSNAAHVSSGELKTGGQEHFYMETQCCLVIPSNENDEIEVISATQNPTEVQRAIASMLGIDMHLVKSKSRRIGGGFGGKETRCVPYALAAAFAAFKTKKVVRFMLDREQDMVSSGTRHPTLCRYKIGYDGLGRMLALEAEIYLNAGYTADLSFAVLEKALTHLDNAYNIPNCHVKGFCCKTNIPSNTAFRGFGAPQSMLMMETIVERIASELHIAAHEVREINLYKDG